MKQEKIYIHVCKKIDNNLSHCYPDYNLTELETIERIPFHKGFLGNFVPHYCRYKNKTYIIHGGIDYAYMHDTDKTRLYIVINN